MNQISCRNDAKPSIAVGVIQRKICRDLYAHGMERIFPCSRRRACSCVDNRCSEALRAVLEDLSGSVADGILD
jgi:hypothetical protein